MLPPNIQPFIINISNLSSTTAYPVTIFDTYNTLSPVYNTKQYYSHTITIAVSTPPNQIFNFSYIDTNAVVQYFTLDGTIPFDTFIYIGLYPPTLLNTPTMTFGYSDLLTPVSYTPPNNTPYSYQNNQNIVINMNPNLNCTYPQFLEAIMTNPFSIEKIFFSADNGSQIAQDKPITIFNKDINGNESNKKFMPFINPFQVSSEGIIIDNKQSIDGFTGFKINSLLPSTNVQIYFYPKKRAEQKLSKNQKFIENTNEELAFKQKNLYEKSKRFEKYVAEKEIELYSIKDESIVIGKRVKLLSEIKEFNNFIESSKKRLGLD